MTSFNKLKSTVGSADRVLTPDLEDAFNSLTAHNTERVKGYERA